MTTSPAGHCTGVTIVRYPHGGSIRELVISMADGTTEVYKVTDDTGCALGDARHYALGSCVVGEPPPDRTGITEPAPRRPEVTET
jgi:hypothetical protein